MKFPKLIDGPNAVGEAKARHLETIDSPFLTAIGPGFVASKKGPFSEVTGVQESKSVVYDGWFSFSEPDFGSVVVHGSFSPETTFRKRGSFANSYSSSPLFPSGRGWGYLRELLAFDSPTTGYNSFRYLKSRTGRSGSQIFASDYLANTVELQQGYSTKSVTEEAVYNNGYQIISFGAENINCPDGVIRQRPLVKLFWESSPNFWSEKVFPSPILLDNDTYTTASGCVLSPGVYAFATLKINGIDIRPTIYITRNDGATWTTCPALPDIYPGQGSSWDPFLTRGDIAASFPSLTPQEVETQFIGQATVKRIAYGAELTMYAVAEDRILINVLYLESTPGNQLQSLSMVDPYTGTLKWQKWNNHGDESLPRPFYDVKPTAFGSWIYFLVDSDFFTILESKVVSDFGATETDVLLPIGFVSFDAPFYHREESNETNLSPPKLYFMASDGVTSYLALTRDYFATSKITAKVGDFILSSADFSEVVWVGTRDNKGPINPTFPWVSDTKFPIPDWWVNVSAYGG